MDLSGNSSSLAAPTNTLSSSLIVSSCQLSDFPLPGSIAPPSVLPGPYTSPDYVTPPAKSVVYVSLPVPDSLPSTSLSYAQVAMSKLGTVPLTPSVTPKTSFASVYSRAYNLPAKSSP